MGVILLDIGNVVVNVDFMTFCRAVSRDGEAGEAAIMERYCQGESKDRFDTGRISSDDYLDMIASDTHVSDMPRHRLRLAWQDIFTPLSGSDEAVSRLKRDHRIWIMSDTDPLHFAFLIECFPVVGRADRYFLSCEHGVLKRSPEAFRQVLDRSGVAAADMLLIDDREVNTASAAEAGIRSILFRSWPETLNSPLLAAFSQQNIQ